MRSLVILLVVLVVVGVVGYYIITQFRLPDVVLILFGVLLLAALVLGAFRFLGIGGPRETLD